jgi:hypothetical protein
MTSLICITETDGRYTPLSCPFLDTQGVCNHPTKINQEVPYKCQSTPDSVSKSYDLNRLASRVVVTAFDPRRDSGYVPILAACLVGVGIVAVWWGVVRLMVRILE